MAKIGLNAAISGAWWTATTSRLSKAWTASTVDVPCPDVSPIQLVHRGTGYATFHRKESTIHGDDWVNIGAVSTGELAAKFPVLTEEVGVNAYFCINTTYRTGYSASGATGLPWPLRKKRNLAFLNALSADLDCHDKPFDPAAALQAVFELIEAGVIPVPSILVRSGRGMWLLWLLVDVKDIHSPQRAWPDKTEIFGRVQKAIQQRLATLGADRNALDPARVMRVPGSLNTRAAAGFQQVLFFPLTDPAGQPIVYTLPQMAAIFDVAARKTAVVPTHVRRSRSDGRVVDEKVRKAKQTACRARWRYSLEDFEVLRRLRGGFKLGHRTNSVFFYTRLLAFNRVTESEIRRAVIKLALECKPPLPLDKCLTTMRGALRYKKPLRGDTCLQKLGVTAEERPYLPHWCPPVKKLKKQEIAERRNIIRAEAAWLPATPSCSQMALILSRRGIVVTTRTIANDYRALGLRSGRPAGRPKQTHAGDDVTRKKEC